MSEEMTRISEYAQELIKADIEQFLFLKLIRDGYLEIEGTSYNYTKKDGKESLECVDFYYKKLEIKREGDSEPTFYIDGKVVPKEKFDKDFEYYLKDEF